MVRSLCFLLLAVNFFGLVESNNCVVDLTDCPSKSWEKRVDRDRGCGTVTTPTSQITKPSSECKKTEYEVHLSNRAATYWGSKVCYRKYQICRGKEGTQPPTPTAECTVGKVTGEWVLERDINHQSTTKYTVTVGTTTTSGSAAGKEYKEEIGVEMQSGFQLKGFSAGITVSSSSSKTLWQEYSMDITKSTTEQREVTIPDVAGQVNRKEWQFVITSEGKCGNAEIETKSELRTLAYSRKDRAPCCLPGQILDADRYASCICTKGSVISEAKYCVEDHDGSEDSAKNRLNSCGWDLSMLSTDHSDQSWLDVAFDCCLTKPEVSALKQYTLRCNRCPNGCTQKDSSQKVGKCDKKAEQQTFGSTACCCPIGFQSDCTGTKLRTATNTSTEIELSSAESASKTLFSCSVLVFILHLLL